MNKINNDEQLITEAYKKVYLKEQSITNNIVDDFEVPVSSISIVQNDLGDEGIINLKAFSSVGKAKQYIEKLQSRIAELNDLYDEDPETDHSDYDDVMGIGELVIARMDVY